MGKAKSRREAGDVNREKPGVGKSNTKVSSNPCGVRLTNKRLPTSGEELLTEIREAAKRGLMTACEFVPASKLIDLTSLLHLKYDRGFGLLPERTAAHDRTFKELFDFETDEV